MYRISGRRTRRHTRRLPAWVKRGLVITALVLVPQLGFAACSTLSTPIVGAIKNMDWNDAFPITIMGFPLGGNGNPPRMYEPPICLCPSRFFGTPLPGIGISYWMPLYMADTSSEAGCLQSMGFSILSGYSAQNSGNGDSAGNRRQIHWYSFPLFRQLQMFMDLACSSSTSYFDLAYLTEIDPVWQDDLWSAVMAPESALVANPISRLACSADAVSVSIAYPIDALFWCLGADHMYPLSGNSNVAAANEDVNMKALGRFLFRHHRIGALWETIGPEAQCSAVYSPVLPKSQYRLDPIFPSANNTSRPIYLGKKYLFWGGMPPPVVSYPTHESGAFVLWRGTQCCIRF